MTDPSRWRLNTDSILSGLAGLRATGLRLAYASCRLRVPTAKHTMPTAIRTAHGIAISLIVKLRHTPPSIASIVQRIGLMKLIDWIHAGMMNVGTIAPPTIDSGIRIAHPAPDAVCSVLPRLATSIMKPTKQIAADSPASASIA